MLFDTDDGRCLDTDKDLTSAERHILQKLLFWEEMAVSVEAFRQKKEEAFRKGWNGSGPVSETEAMRSILRHMEGKVRRRLSP